MSHERDAQSHERDTDIRIDHARAKIQIFTDFIQTLSNSERESFLEFGRKKASQLPKSPELPLKWIEANWQELYAQFKSTDEAAVASVSDTDWTQHQDWESWLSETVTKEELMKIMTPSLSGYLTSYSVIPLVNNVKVKIGALHDEVHSPLTLF